MMEKSLGQILLEKNMITQAQLDLALKRQKQQKGKYLGQILIEMGLVSQEKINKVLDAFNKRKRIGEILIDLEIITPEQLETALRKQKELQTQGVRKPLGAVVLELGFTNYDSYMLALSKHFNMPIVYLETFYPTPTLQRALGEKYAMKNRIVVLENTPSRIKLALAEPTHRILEEVQKAVPFGKTVEFYLANPYEVDSCLRKKFDPFSVTRYR
jgi:MshEN domain